MIFYLDQLEHGLIVTHMRDQVSWGLYIANFTFLVGVAAAAVLLVIPAYIYHFEPIKEITVLGELLAFSSLIMCLLFIIVDFGRPERFWHIVPGIGKWNFPDSLLTWDTIVLSGYLILNTVLPLHILYKNYNNQEPNQKIYVPLVLISIPWAISIHTVTAFIYNPLPARPFWNTAILAPRFLASAFCSGPAIMLIVFQILKRLKKMDIKEEALFRIADIMAYAMFFNILFTIAEVFKDYYSATSHISQMKYLYEGLGEHRKLVPYIWTASALNVSAFALFITIRHFPKKFLMNLGCVFTIIGVYIEKGLCFIVPGFVPDPLGEIYEYFPSFHEMAISVGIFATGFFIYTVLCKPAVAIMGGKLRHKG
ncbi:MAG: NrfD/PsrC family molybdoenzyme membrane anchor subunit [Deltaproteobacteria bacterium]|nr:NrfD/PsrC family molybdoenzyme membrane anchor subunit [Deltaproteobacteria bacterium]